MLPPSSSSTSPADCSMQQRAGLVAVVVGHDDGVALLDLLDRVDLAGVERQRVDRGRAERGEVRVVAGVVLREVDEVLELVDVELALAQRGVELRVVGEVLDLEVDALLRRGVLEGLPVGVAGADGAERDLGGLLAAGRGVVTAAHQEERRDERGDDEDGEADRAAASVRDFGGAIWGRWVGHGGAFRWGAVDAAGGGATGHGTRGSQGWRGVGRCASRTTATATDVAKTTNMIRKLGNYSGPTLTAASGPTSTVAAFVDMWVPSPRAQRPRDGCILARGHGRGARAQPHATPAGSPCAPSCWPSQRPTDLLETVPRLTAAPARADRAPSRRAPTWCCGAGSARRTTPQRAARRRSTSSALLELRGMLRPAEDLALFRAEMAAWPGRGELRDWQEEQRDWVEANDACRRDILARLRADGPLPSCELPDTCVVPWKSSGWNDNRNVADAARPHGPRAARSRPPAASGRDRLWDLAERVYPDDPRCPSRRRGGSAPSGGCARWASPGPSDRTPGRADRRRRGGRAGRRRGRPGRLAGRPGAARPAVRGPGGAALARSTGWSSTASGWPSSSSSTTSWRCTSRPPSAAGATTRCRSSTATGWSASSTPRPTATTGVLRVDAPPRGRAVHAKREPTAVDREIADLARWLDLEVDRVG